MFTTTESTHVDLAREAILALIKTSAEGALDFKDARTQANCAQQLAEAYANVAFGFLSEDLFPPDDLT